MTAFAVIMQKHPGWVGKRSKAFEAKDREIVARKLRQHVEGADNNPLLIFPEGTCSKQPLHCHVQKEHLNSAAPFVLLQIKYNKIFVDAFWNSRKQSFTMHLLQLMTSWAVVCDVWYLEPQNIRPGETPTSLQRAPSIERGSNRVLQNQRQSTGREIENKWASSFSCSSAGTCDAIIDYTLPNVTTFSAVKKLFQLKNLRSLLGVNNLPINTPADQKLPANQTIKIPFPCLCRNGTGISNKRPTYTVIAGDFLSHIVSDIFAGNTIEGIAQQYNVSLVTPLRLNGLASSKELLAGSVLDVPLKACQSMLAMPTIPDKVISLEDMPLYAVPSQLALPLAMASRDEFRDMEVEYHPGCYPSDVAICFLFEINLHGEICKRV
ncbi:hypothetical protein HAX54_051892 [Datura stramonium]|uniref:LysM domain-containing protein n=1 Tax=Datura stramonium TaxID=4076 RepID=A0ABS8SY72_DATST|nr:hypothetical protein [Datura stramonium]